MLLADELFLITWDTAGSGAPILHMQATSLGLAGALLAELVLLERVTVRGAQVWVTSKAPVEDPLAQRVLELMIATPEHSDVRTWLAYFAQSAVDSVAGRLVRGGLVTREETRSMLLRKGTRYLATDYARGAWPINRVELMLTNQRPMTLVDMALVALIDATGLLDWLLSKMQDRRTVRHYIATLMATLPAPLRDLAGHVQTAVGNAVLSYRSRRSP